MFDNKLSPCKNCNGEGTLKDGWCRDDVYWIECKNCFSKTDVNLSINNAIDDWEKGKINKNKSNNLWEL